MICRLRSDTRANQRKMAARGWGFSEIERSREKGNQFPVLSPHGMVAALDLRIREGWGEDERLVQPTLYEELAELHGPLLPMSGTCMRPSAWDKASLSEERLSPRHGTCQENL